MDESNPSAGLKILKLATPIIPDIMAVNANTTIVTNSIFPSFLELSILAMADEMLKNTSGINIVNIKFRNIVPSGSKTLALSPIINPIIPPIITENIKIIEDL